MAATTHYVISQRLHIRSTYTVGAAIGCVRTPARIGRFCEALRPGRTALTVHVLSGPSPTLLTRTWNPWACSIPIVDWASVDPVGAAAAELANAIGAALAGYVGLAKFVSQQIVITGAILATMYIGFLSARAMSEEGAFGQTKLGGRLGRCDAHGDLLVPMA